MYCKVNYLISVFKETARSFKRNRMFLGVERVVPFKGTTRFF